MILLHKWATHFSEAIQCNVYKQNWGRCAIILAPANNALIFIDMVDFCWTGVFNGRLNTDYCVLLRTIIRKAERGPWVWIAVIERIRFWISVRTDILYASNLYVIRQEKKLSKSLTKSLRFRLKSLSWGMLSANSSVAVLVLEMSIVKLIEGMEIALI